MCCMCAYIVLLNISVHWCVNKVSSFMTLKESGSKSEVLLVNELFGALQVLDNLLTLWSCTP